MLSPPASLAKRSTRLTRLARPSPCGEEEEKRDIHRGEARAAHSELGERAVARVRLPVVQQTKCEELGDFRSRGDCDYCSKKRS